MDEGFMRRALELAELGRGYTSPNPVVGAVIARDGRIIGEGWHKAYGGPHAEINAFRSADEEVKGADMYVTLEPCSHYGKTPPCAEEIIRRKIGGVYVGMTDPNPLVSGRGISLLRDSGIEVVSGVLEKECLRINEVFIKYITTGRPFVVMKTAMTLDGKIAAYTGDSKWITGQPARDYVHRLRSSLSAVMVGVETVIKDDPMLTARIEGGRDPIRIIADSGCRIPIDARAINQNGRCIIAATEKAPCERVEALEAKGVTVLRLPGNNGRVDLCSLMEKLGQMQIDSVLLEGGGELNFSALRQGIVDKVISFIAPKIIGGRDSKTPVEGNGITKINDAIELGDITVKQLGNDLMVTSYVKDGEYVHRLD